MGEAAAATRHPCGHGERNRKEQHERRGIPGAVAHDLAHGDHRAHEEQRAVGDELDAKEGGKPACLPCTARAMVQLIDKRDPVVRGIPEEHGQHHDGRDQRGDPGPGRRQHRQSATRGQDDGHGPRCQDRRVFCKPGEPEQHAERDPEPKPRSASAFRAHQRKRDLHERERQRHQQGVGQQADGQHMHHGGEQGEAHGPDARHLGQTAWPGRHDAKQLTCEVPGEQAGCEPQCLRDQANGPDRRADRDQWPLDPSHQRRVIEVTPVRANRVVHVMRFVDRQRQ